MSKFKQQGKELPTDFRRGFEINRMDYWTPTWRERLAIFCGYNLVIGFRIITEHRAGEIAVGTFPVVTKHSLEDHNNQPELNRIGITPNPTQMEKSGVNLEKTEKPKL
jgi:hypothetical protein